jgi:hypothetical protein
MKKLIFVAFKKIKFSRPRLMVSKKGVFIIFKYCSSNAFLKKNPLGFF